MLTKALSLLFVIFLGLVLGLETARFVHAHTTSVVAGATSMVNIHRALLGFSLLATSGALLLSLRADRRGGLGFGAWFSRQWSRFTVWLELTLDFDALNVGHGTGPVVLRGDDAKRLLANPFVDLPASVLPRPGTPEYEACAARLTMLRGQPA